MMRDCYRDYSLDDCSNMTTATLESLRLRRLGSCRRGRRLAEGDHAGRTGFGALLAENELRATKAQLQAAIDELETRIEDMKSTTEEFQAVNEELQSTNEELETSKEELQSVNEELQIINSELNNKNELLTHFNADMQNLLDSTQIATVFSTISCALGTSRRH
jgi:two-component system, chemotaxis family, CheB/CheR fusion protein